MSAVRTKTKGEKPKGEKPKYTEVSIDEAVALCRDAKDSTPYARRVCEIRANRMKRSGDEMKGRKEIRVRLPSGRDIPTQDIVVAMVKAETAQWKLFDKLRKQAGITFDKNNNVIVGQRNAGKGGKKNVKEVPKIVKEVTSVPDEKKTKQGGSKASRKTSTDNAKLAVHDMLLRQMHQHLNDCTDTIRDLDHTPTSEQQATMSEARAHMCADHSGGSIDARTDAAEKHVAALVECHRAITSDTVKAQKDDLNDLEQQLQALEVVVGSDDGIVVDDDTDEAASDSAIVDVAVDSSF